MIPHLVDAIRFFNVRRPSSEKRFGSDTQTVVGSHASQGPFERIAPAFPYVPFNSPGRWNVSTRFVRRAVSGAANNTV